MSDTPEFSVIIPVHNEETVLETVISNVCAVMGAFPETFEIVMVDDGSTDHTWDVIRTLAQANPNVIGYQLNRNFGHQAAIFAGLNVARGQAIAIMDGDGQDPPEVLAKLFSTWKEGYDVAYAVRRTRKENFIKRACYRGFYRVLSLLARVPIPLDSGDFSVMDRKVARFITSINDRSPFVRGLRSWYGGKQVAVEYERLARLGGTTKYSWFNLFDLALNGITSLSKLPLRLAIYAGGGISLLALSYGSFVVARRLLFGYPEGWGWSSAVTLIAFLNGLTLLLMGFIGEYIGHVFDASKQFPVYLVRESTNHGDGPRPRV